MGKFEFAGAMRLPFCSFTLAVVCPLLAAAHPAELADYPERFLGKTLQQIVKEWEPVAVPALSDGDLLALTRDVTDDWQKTPAAELRKRLEALIVKNRQGDYRKRIANLLHDMLDLLSSGEAGLSAEAADYLSWRLEHLHTDDGYFDEVGSGHWDETKQQQEERTRTWHDQRNQEVFPISAKADTATLALRPHWLIQCGALEFKHRRYQQAEGFFQRVREAFPQHPRAEVATLMLARMKFDQWRQITRSWRKNSEEEAKLSQQFWDAVRLYSERYPQGRYTLDLIGWQAGIAREQGHLSEALKVFLQEAAKEQKEHPEIRRRAFQQIEWLLQDFADHPEELEQLPWKEIAAEPVVALRLGYFMLDPLSEFDLGAYMQRRSGEDHRALEKLAPVLAGVRSVAKPAWLPFDQALAAEANAYQGGRFVIRDILQAWAATMTGKPALALAALSARHEGAGVDDVLWVRAAAWIKQGQHAEALRALDELEANCPDSTLLRDCQLRRADAWIHLGQASAAIPILWQMLEDDGVAISRVESTHSPALHLAGEASQRLSALLGFAPVAQLELAVRRENMAPRLRVLLCGALRIRHLSEERFDECLKYSKEADFEDWTPLHGRSDGAVASLASQWRERVLSLQTLHQAVQQAPNAESWLALGKAWEQQLWRLLDGGMVYVPERYLSGDVPLPSYEARHHASLLGLNDEAAARVLDQRQEMTHAIHCYEEASKIAAKGSAASLQSLLAIHQGLCVRAEVSPYFRDRAVERGDASYARELYDRIKVEHPGSLEASRAVWWTFQPSAILGEWQPGVSALFAVEAKLAALLGGVPDTVYWDSDWRMEVAVKDLSKRLQQALAQPKPLDELRREINNLRAAVRREAPTIRASQLLNHLDDFSLLLEVPNLNPDALRAYASARLEGKSVDASDPMFAGVQDFASFWNLVITPSTQALTVAELELAQQQPERPARQRVAQAQVCRMTDFLQRFPQSAKREAALARLAINTLRQSRTHCGLVYIDPIAGVTTAYAGFGIERGIPFEVKNVMTALDRYEQEFPSGMYQWDVRLIRGIAASEARDWHTAIKHLVAVLNQPDKRDLHLDASNNLCAIFMELLTPEHRMSVLEAIKQNPGAWEKLDQFIHSPSCGWRLRVLEGWLQAQR